LDGFEEKMSIIIMDMSGKIMLSSSEKVESFDVSALQSGLYLLEVSDGKTIIRQKFMK
jgi:hypothetical protein